MRGVLSKVIYVLIVNIVTESASDSKPRIVIAGLFPLSDGIPEGEIGKGVRPAVNLALDMINKSPNILPNYTLDVIANDTKCDMAVATKFFFDMVDSNNTMVMVFGDACSSVSGPVAEIAKEWNVWLLSYADTDPALSDRKKYSNFYRTVPSESNFNPARLALLRKFNWTHVGTIFQGVSKGPARYGHAHNHLVSLLEDNGINVLKSTGFVNDPGPAIKELKEADARIIIGNFDAAMARHVFCQAYAHNMFGDKYQWMLLGDYPDNWWEIKDPNLSCTPDELQTTIQGYIATDILPLSSTQDRTESGLTPQQYLEMYQQSNGGHYSKFHAYAFDGLWVIAKTVDKIVRLQSRLNATVLHSNMFRGQTIAATLNRTNFKGVTGRVRFQKGERIGSILLQQLQGKSMVKIGEYHSLTDTLTNCNRIWWKGDDPPLDRKLVQIEYLRVPRGIYLCVCTLSGCGVLVSAFFLMINICFREHRFIKMSSPNLNNIVIIGCILTYTSVFLLGLDGGMVDTQCLGRICTARAWVLSVGFTLAFGAMFSKTWRVHSIFTDIKLNKKVIKDFKLFLLVTILLIIDAVILITWQITDPLRTAATDLYAQVHVEKDLDVVFVLEYCTSGYITTWLGLLYAYKGLLLVVGCFLAWETRHVSIPALNDSKYIGMSVYNVVIMCVCGAAVSFVINDQPIPSFVIIGFFIIFCTTITLCLVFVPKVLELKRDPYGEERKSRTKIKKSKTHNSEEVDEFLYRRNKELVDENIRYRNIIAQKLRVLHDLLEQLGEENISDQLYFVNHGPINTKIIHLEIKDPPGPEIDVSDCSDISCGSTSWAIGSCPFQRIQIHSNNKSVTSLWSDTSLDDLVEDNSCNPNQEKKAKTESAAPTEEADDDDESELFGGVYLGPPDPPKTTKATSLQHTEQELKDTTGYIQPPIQAANDTKGSLQPQAQVKKNTHASLQAPRQAKKHTNTLLKHTNQAKQNTSNTYLQPPDLAKKNTNTHRQYQATCMKNNTTYHELSNLPRKITSVFIQPLGSAKQNTSASSNLPKQNTASSTHPSVARCNTNNNSSIQHSDPCMKKTNASPQNGVIKTAVDIKHVPTMGSAYDQTATVSSNGTECMKHTKDNIIMQYVENGSRDIKDNPHVAVTTPSYTTECEHKFDSTQLISEESLERFSEYLLETLPKQMSKTEILLKNKSKKEECKGIDSISCDLIEHI